MSNEKIVERIKKLLAMTGEAGATDGEIENAVGRAKAMMNEYHLTEADLSHEPADDYSKIKPEDFTRCPSYVGTAIFAWEQRLAYTVSEFVGCPAYIDNNIQVVRKNGIAQFDDRNKLRHGKSIVFYGVPEDARIAADLYDEMRLTIATMAAARYGKVYRGEGASYSEGFVSGLNSNLKKASLIEYKAAEGSSTSLVLIARRDDLVQFKKDAAKGWLANSEGVKLRGSGRGNPGSRWGNSDEARAQGRADGKNTNMSASRSKKIGG